MKTREDAVRTARHMLRNDPTRLMAVYRVGSQWMFTGCTEEVTQSHYKVQIKDYEVVKPE